MLLKWFIIDALSLLLCTLKLLREMQFNIAGEEKETIYST